MPIDNSVNIKDKIVYSTCTGVMMEEDFSFYIKEIWSHDQYYGFNELFNTVQADWSEFDFGYLLVIAESASKLNTIDPDSKLAWLVLEGKQKELTDFYKTVKSFMPVRSRSLETFYSKDKAMRWLRNG